MVARSGFEPDSAAYETGKHHASPCLKKNINKSFSKI